MNTSRSMLAVTISVMLMTVMLACNKKSGSSSSGSLRMTLHVSPEHPSMTKPTAFAVHLENPQGQPVNDAQVSGALTMKLMDMGATQLTFTPKGNGDYAASVEDLEMSGPWSLEVSASAGGTEVEQSFDVTVGD